ncbi:MAG: hydrogenase [Deltaproteobacteria bacterium]|jgi:hydrogenase-4 component E|nr:hydrogenase [Deltaproteobacteria bacterium]
MIYSVDTILSLVLLSVLFSFGSSRLPGLIKVIAFQGIVVSLVPLFIEHDLTTGTILFSLVTMVIRGIVIPLSIHLVIKKVSINRGVEPIIGFHASLFAGLILIVAAAFVSHRLNIPSVSTSALLTPTAITILVAGMFILMTRRNAIAMVLGYMMMENGIYLVGTTFSTHAHHIVEFGILLDVLAGVMIMAIMLRDMKQKFDGVDTVHLRNLKE